MPDEPNKKMDEMLRTYAQERRKGVDVQLHPATRNLLQGEVRRVFGTEERRPWWKRLRAFWPQLTFAGSMCLIMGIAILSLRESPRDEPAAMKESEVELLPRRDESALQEKDASSKLKGQTEEQSARSLTELKQAAPPPEARAPQGPVAGNRDLRREEVLTRGMSPAQQPAIVPQERYRPPGDASARERVLTDAATATAPSTTVSEMRLQKKLEAPAKAEDANQPALNEAVALQSAPEGPLKTVAGRSASPRPASVSLAADMTNLGAARRLNFVQVSNVSAKAIAPSGSNAVLTSFQVEQLGNSVKFLDRDGSVYSGELEATNSVAALALTDDARKLDSSAAYYFRVQGTNRTLGKNVVLTGEYLEQTNQAPSSLDTFAIAPGNAARQKVQPRFLIIGNATVGSTNQVPVRAVGNEP
jgi:hypothetical protein